MPSGYPTGPGSSKVPELDRKTAGESLLSGQLLILWAQAGTGHGSLGASARAWAGVDLLPGQAARRRPAGHPPGFGVGISDMPVQAGWPQVGHDPSCRLCASSAVGDRVVQWLGAQAWLQADGGLLTCQLSHLQRGGMTAPHPVCRTVAGVK